MSENSSSPNENVLGGIIAADLEFRSDTFVGFGLAPFEIKRVQDPGNL